MRRKRSLALPVILGLEVRGATKEWGTWDLHSEEQWKSGISTLNS
jgi:hypothetical protein